ncbi:MAG TPA: phosphatase PAP2-related protein [Candidatus Paceibacterota bacterium]|nr:phosphatase PAP2-related protein [Candidatus Paceibacterota bacterium]
MFSNIPRKYREAFSNKKFIFSLLISILLLLITLVLNYFAALYAYERASGAVADIVLSNIPVFDVDMIFVFGPIIFGIWITFLCLLNPRTLPFTLKSVAMFVLIRSIFITLTHIGPFPDHAIIDGNSAVLLRALSDSPNFFLFSTGADLFFSGHTGLPFMMGLVFWRHSLTRTFCIATSIFFGIIVLLGHLHYSIDVASAFFITYTIYVMTRKIFKKDFADLSSVM